MLYFLTVNIRFLYVVNTVMNDLYSQLKKYLRGGKVLCEYKIPLYIHYIIIYTYMIHDHTCLYTLLTIYGFVLTTYAYDMMKIVAINSHWSLRDFFGVFTEFSLPSLKVGL